MKIEHILSRIPEYESFFTVDELDTEVHRLASQFPKIVETFQVGYSRNGHEILGMKLGNGTANALCFACPHPNEPIGAMTMISLARIFAEDPDLLNSTKYTWYLIPCIDPDGTRLNEGWFKGPFSLTNYVRDFYRPVGHEQVEWTFPLDYKGIYFDKPIPETKALMKLMEDLKPKFMFSLHNAAFGGAYWYLTDNIPELCIALERTAVRQDVPLQLGEPEAAYITKFSPAVHSMLSMKDYFDYIEKYTGELPKSAVQCGTSSADYVKSICDCVCMMAELPYFADKRIEDMSHTEMTRREVATMNLDLSEKSYTFLKSAWDRLEKLFTAENPFSRFVSACVKDGENGFKARRKQLADPEFDEIATVSQWFDNVFGVRIFECLNLALMVRACDFELNKASGENTSTFLEEKERIHQELSRMCTWLEENVDYEVLPIKRLVSVQLESALVAAEHILKE